MAERLTHKTLHTYAEWLDLGFVVMKGERTVGFYKDGPLFSYAQVERTHTERAYPTGTPYELWNHETEDGDPVAAYHTVPPDALPDPEASTAG